jgi:LuxR family maltose regulon positive regulatory protein
MTKLRPPPARKQWVHRERLLEQLRPEPGVRLTAVVAPAGSGKTTLLTAWCDTESGRRPVGWVSLDEGDNDLVSLWSHAFEALRQACPALEGLRSPELVGAGHILEVFLPDLVNGLAEQGDAVLVLDDFHRVQSASVRESVAWLVEHAPASFQFVVSTRTEPALGLPALRARGELLELRARDLGFSVDEAEILLNDRLELGLEREDVDELVERTEGWASGLYLAALSLGGVEDRHAFVQEFGGTNRPVLDFLVEEVLEGIEPELQTLMLRCSVVDRLSGPLCDALLEQKGSGELLGELTRKNLFLIPVDDHGQWYRFHHLFVQLLRVELEHREPELAPTLHRRALAWHRDHGSTDEAIEHAICAGAFGEAADLISTAWIHHLNSCQVPTVIGWLKRVPARVVDTSPVLLTLKAWGLFMCGMQVEALEAVATIEHMGDGYDGPLPCDASSVKAVVATLSATIQRGDVGAGLENAVRAADLQEPEGPFWAVVSWANGMARFYRGEFAEAAPWFTEAAQFAPSVDMWLIAASAFAYLSFIAGEHGDGEQQMSFAEQAMYFARERRIEEIVGEAPAALGASLAASGELEQARPLLEQSVLALRAYGQPLDLAYALIRQARVLLALRESNAAAASIAEARAMIDSCRDPGIVEEWLVALERPRRRRDGELSKRELVVLRALTGPLSERDIGRELFLSHSTVHSHAQSIYRKLGVSSRTGAIQEARKIGLL